MEEKLVAFVDERDCVLVRIWDLARPADPFAAELAPERPELELVALQQLVVRHYNDELQGRIVVEE